MIRSIMRYEYVSISIIDHIFYPTVKSMYVENSFPTYEFTLAKDFIINLTG